MSENHAPQDVTFTQALLPVLFLSVLIIYGLILRPQFFDQPAFPLEIIFILAAAFTSFFWPSALSTHLPSTPPT